MKSTFEILSRYLICCHTVIWVLRARLSYLINPLDSEKKSQLPTIQIKIKESMYGVGQKLGNIYSVWY